MKKILILLIACCLLSCNKEKVKVEGDLKNSTAQCLIVKVKSFSGENQQILDTVEVEKGIFKFTVDQIKPPVKLSICGGENCEFDLWIGEYGKKYVHIDPKATIKLSVAGSFFCDELIRIQKSYNNMYLEPIKEKLDKLSDFNKLVEKGEVLTDEEEEVKCELEKVCNKAYRIRKKSILKTVRKDPNNPIAMGLIYDEFDSLTSWQKEEALKYMSKYFSDTGLNWQMKN